jgi:nucleobase:cation symporter-1, NCS1 family
MSSHGVPAHRVTVRPLLSQQGPIYEVPKMVLSRLGFGYWGNVLPAGLNAVTAGVGWFAVNSVSGAFALNEDSDQPRPEPPGRP